MADKSLIYAVDDEESIRELYDCALTDAGYSAQCFVGGRDLFSALDVRLPALIILDIMLDGEDGYSILHTLKNNARTKDIPVIMVSAKGEEMSKVKGLNMGADDYVSKPFGVLELIARVKANLRKYGKRQDRITYGDITVDDKRHQAVVCGEPVDLTLKGYGILKMLVANAPDVVLREDIFRTVWGEDYYGETRTLDIHVAALRKAIASAANEIKTVRGVGYMLI